MVSDALRGYVRKRAGYLCEYCHSPEYLSPDLFTVDHLQPRSLQGSDHPDNLALACRRCNNRHYNFTDGQDPETQEIVALFNPRQQSWSEHFVWSSDGLRILGKTAVGRATCYRLDLNDDCHDGGAILDVRQFWASAGWHPPVKDPVQPKA